MKRIVVPLMVVALFALLVAADALARGKSFKGQKAPEISLSQAANTKGTPTLSSLKGKAVLLEFWATWCPPCRQSVPHLVQIHNKYKDKGLVVIGVTQEDPGTVKPFMQSNNMTYIVGIDSAGKTNKTYGITGIPAAFLIGPEGTVEWEGHPMQLTDEIIESVVQKVEKK